VWDELFNPFGIVGFERVGGGVCFLTPDFIWGYYCLTALRSWFVDGWFVGD